MTVQNVLFYPVIKRHFPSNENYIVKVICEYEIVEIIHTFSLYLHIPMSLCEIFWLVTMVWHVKETSFTVIAYCNDKMI